MGFCTRRHFFLSICLLQILSVVQRQVFDFLGFLWIPILVNFFEIIFIIFGFFGAYQYRPKYVIAYLLWHIFWLAWNVFVICLYLDVAGLDHKTNKVLKLDINSASWWKVHGPGCKIVATDDDVWNPQNIDGCWIDYEEVEIFQAGLQCFLAFFGCIIGICLSRLYMEEDDTFNFEKPDGPDNFLLQPMYVRSQRNLSSSNRYINVKSTDHDSSTLDSLKMARVHHADTIRSTLGQPNEYSIRPKSLATSNPTYFN